MGQATEDKKRLKRWREEARNQPQHAMLLDEYDWSTPLQDEEE